MLSYQFFMFMIIILILLIIIISLIMIRSKLRSSNNRYYGNNESTKKQLDELQNINNFFIDNDYDKTEKDIIIKVVNSPVEWDKLDLEINYDKHTAYRRTPNLYKSVMHWGQRKLLMNEIYFLTYYGDLSNIVVYAGAAMGKHILYLSSLFPNHKFYLYDPNKFYEGLFKNPNIEIHNGYFTNDVAKSWSDKNILFMSDIRVSSKEIQSGPRTETGVVRFEEQVMTDMNMQKEWVDIIKPSMAMLKFRLPYNNDNIEYFDGKIYIQPWAPLKSTETRLITDGKSIKSYDSGLYNDTLYYHNIITRIWQFYNIPIDIHKIKTFDISYDSVCEMNILYLYNEKIKGIKDSKENWDQIIIMCNEISKLLGPHPVSYIENREYLDQPMYKKRKILVNKYKYKFLKFLKDKFNDDNE